MVLLPLVFGLAAMLFLLIVSLIFIKMFVYVVSPNKLAVISGRHKKIPDGRVVGYRYIIGGRTVRFPILEQFETMDLNTMPVEFETRNAYSKGQIVVNVKAYANVKISTDPELIHNAIEYFLGQNSEQITRVARETLEGNLRVVIATNKPEKIIGITEKLKEKCKSDFNKLGLQMDDIHILSVEDNEGYLSGFGEKTVAELKKQLEMDENIQF
jgi:flotillin